MRWRKEYAVMGLQEAPTLQKTELQETSFQLKFVSELRKQFLIWIGKPIARSNIRLSQEQIIS